MCPLVPILRPPWGVLFDISQASFSEVFSLYQGESVRGKKTNVVLECVGPTMWVSVLIRVPWVCLEYVSTDFQEVAFHSER